MNYGPLSLLSGVLKVSYVVNYRVSQVNDLSCWLLFVLLLDRLLIHPFVARWMFWSSVFCWCILFYNTDSETE